VPMTKIPYTPAPSKVKGSVTLALHPSRFTPSPLFALSPSAARRGLWIPLPMALLSTPPPMNGSSLFTRPCRPPPGHRAARRRGYLHFGIVSFRASLRRARRFPHLNSVTIQQDTKVIGGATHRSVVGPDLASFVPSRDMTPPHAGVESSAFNPCEFVTKGKSDWELVSRGAKGTKFSKLQTAFSSTPFLCVLCAPSRQRTRWIISTRVLERQNLR